MIRTLARFLAVVGLSLLFAGPLSAQILPGGSSTTEPEPPAAPVFAYAIAFFGTVAVLVIVCMPSRKS